MKRRETWRSFGVAFCVTLLLCVFAAGSSVVVYNTASVLYGEDQVASLERKGETLELTLLSQKSGLELPGVEEAAERAFHLSPLLPAPARLLFLSLCGIREAAAAAPALLREPAADE